LDASGRILIPLTLRNYAKLTKELMLVGQLNRFEIWSSTVWNDRIAEDLMSIPTENWSNSERLKDFSLNDYE
jgi:MraZ protein